LGEITKTPKNDVGNSGLLLGLKILETATTSSSSRYHEVNNKEVSYFF